MKLGIPQRKGMDFLGAIPSLPAYRTSESLKHLVAGLSSDSRLNVTHF